MTVQVKVREQIGKFVIVAENELDIVIFEVEKHSFTEKYIEEILLQNGFKQRALDIRTYIEKVQTAFESCFQDIANSSITIEAYKS